MNVDLDVDVLLTNWLCNAMKTNLFGSTIFINITKVSFEVKLNTIAM